MIFVLLGITIVYVLAISWLIYGCSQVPLYSKKEVTPKTTFSILVPFRNEAENLPILLESISKLKYPTDLFEVLLIDDASEKEFKVSGLKFKVSIVTTIRISSSPKKDAITTGVPLANNEWIVTTDADCVVPENWLLTMDAFIQNQRIEMIAGAVTYDCKPSFLHHFQQLDLTSLQGATIGSFGINKGFMCNGANFVYTKSLFQKLNGFEGNDKIASGDDVFLLQKAIAQCPEKVHYLKSKETIVRTQPTESWKALFHQRVRWASKTSSYQSRFGIGLGLVVFGGNLSLILVLVTGILGWIPFLYVALLWLTKFMVDSVLLYTTHRFLSHSKMHYWIASSMLYPFFSTSVALYAVFGSYEWKGRRF
ncbi:Glycosyltransferase, catalytic subunit of cellulose synthase and poly-beta-1,6-N-acetylglucosamine synthase [Flavobacterium succinicans]|uniref:Glycosyltransferase, catalytic subunit of cellulose synthase and poly-beta-1,6-N-acetylglucosamine synthase n=1 Tax=Flavobacterium succinicans TaxID=29536 RepID=A0A1I4ZKW7_9FLAO|nr:glycosyltransferase [Flavobacterium succinicans]SFN50807.1 Glycosyltransferase, catalytic subunit of cellulose synthase and poly-beta-1,6-N-acetylglucosamine synthase [Flavobacterium succinicans]